MTITNIKTIGFLAGWGELESWDEVSTDGSVRSFETYEAAPVVGASGVVYGGIALVRETTA